jgi:hypothetical protein
MPAPLWVKGQSGNPNGRPLGSLNKATLTRLQARARFDEKVSEYWDDTIEKLLSNHPVYVADQMMGKADDKLDITSGGEKLDFTQEKLKALSDEFNDYRAKHPR